MGISKVILDGNTIMDLSGVTATAEHVLNGVTAHDKCGEEITGIATPDWTENYIRANISGAYENTDVTGIGEYGFCMMYNKTMTSVSFPNVINIEYKGLYGCYGLTKVDFPVCISLGSQAFASCPSLRSAYLPSVTTIGSLTFNSTPISVLVMPSLTAVPTEGLCTQTQGLYIADFGSNLSSIGIRGLGRRYSTTTDLFKYLILRNANVVVALSNVNAFQFTPFASGGKGGIIYIPKVLYDHLGDGTELDYPAATNWATLNSYGTIPWAQIEGSQYEDYYANGVPIGTGGTIDYADMLECQWVQNSDAATSSEVGTAYADVVTNGSGKRICSGLIDIPSTADYIHIDVDPGYMVQYMGFDDDGLYLGEEASSIWMSNIMLKRNISVSKTISKIAVLVRINDGSNTFSASNYNTSGISVGYRIR